MAGFTYGSAGRWDLSRGFRRAGFRFRPVSLTLALYPTIFVLYLGRFAPGLTAGSYGYLWKLAVVAACVAWNLRGAPAVGNGSVALFALPAYPIYCVRCARLSARNHVAHAPSLGRSRFECCLVDCGNGCDVELHGLGQCIHRSPGGERSAAELSPCNGRSRVAGGIHLHHAPARHGRFGPVRFRLRYRRLDVCCNRDRRTAALA